MTECLQSICPRLQKLARLDPNSMLGVGTGYELAPPLASTRLLHPEWPIRFVDVHGVN